MRAFLVGLITICAITLHANAADRFTVDYIYDGDTFFGWWAGSAKTKSNRVKVRLMGIDTAEIRGQCEQEISLAYRHRDYLRQLITGDVLLEPAGTDKYGRLLAYAYSLDGRDITQQMLSAGQGRPYDGGRRSPWCD